MIKIKNTLLESKHLIIAGVLVFIPLLLFYPTKFTTIDEHDYINNAQLLLNGGLKTDCSLNIPGQWPAGEYCISKYNIGTSLILLPAVILNKNLIALTTFAAFLVGIVVFYKLLQMNKLDKKFIYLFALFPPFIFFTRTALSETYSMSFLLLSFYLLLKANKQNYYQPLAALTIILTLFIRYTNSIPILVILGYLAYSEISLIGIKNTLKKWIYLIVLLFLGIVLFSAFNYQHYGALFRSGYYFSSEEGAIIWEQVPVTFVKYFLLTNIFYPLMLILLFRTKIRWKNLLLSAFLGLFFFYTIIKNVSFADKVTDLILGLRFLIPVYPFALLAYFEFLNRFRDRKYYKSALYTFMVLLIGAAIYINLVHQGFLNR